MILLELLGMLPAESLFCVRVNNLENSLGQIDQFLTGISPMPMFLSMTVRGQLAKLLGSPELTGLNMSGNFALFAVTTAGESTAPKQSGMFIAVLAPVTDYKQFIDGNLKPHTLSCPLFFIAQKKGLEIIIKFLRPEYQLLISGRLAP